METKNTPEARFITVSKFQSIKTKILIFAMLATILPSLVLGWLSYLQSSKLLREKIANELDNATVQASGKLDVWLKDRLYDLRVFSSSYLISENLADMADSSPDATETALRKSHIKAYLKSVGEKFTLYDNLILIDLAGEPVVADAENDASIELPKEWLERLKGELLDGEKNQFAAHVDRKSLFIAEAVRASDGSILGLLAARINLNAIRAILKRQTTGGIDEIYLLDAAGRLLVSTNNDAAEPRYMVRFKAQSASETESGRRSAAEYISHHERAVVGTATPITFMQWRMVAEMEKESAYEEIAALRRITATLVSALMLLIGTLAYIFGHRLVAPVRRLSREAAKVATGDLDVDIPVSGLSEVSYLTQVFNQMVANLRLKRLALSSANQALRETNAELHQISITDGLTGLFNRKHIMELLSREKSRSQRSGSKWSILMLDIDYFKEINDTYGHPIGDKVLRRLAETLTSSVRQCDLVGRYGGEEFMVILPESTIADAARTAERIRANVGNLQFIEEQENFAITVSIGVAGYPDHGEDTEKMLSCADNALYMAKSGGRNRVVAAEVEACSGLATVHVLPSSKRVTGGSACN